MAGDASPVIFLRASEAPIDAKLGRYQRALKQAGIDHVTIYWDRSGQARKDGPNPVFRLRSLEDSATVVLLKLLCFNLFALMQLLLGRREFRIIHAIDLDSAVCAMLASKFTGRRFVFDIYDSFSDSRGLSGKPKQFVDWLEALVIQQADMAIIADNCRLTQHPPIEASKLLVIENIPETEIQFLPLSDREKDANRPLKVGYLGTLEPKHRGLENLCASAAKLGFVELYIAGAGALEPDIRNWTASCPRIKFLGPQSHQDGLKIMQQCDIIAGLYYQSQPNHAYAAPNKYFEHLLLGRPLLTSKGTPPGNKVEAYNSGWAIDDCAIGILEALTKAYCDPQLCQQMGANARRLWEEKFATYFERVYATEYVGRLGKLIEKPNARSSHDENSANKMASR